MLALRRAEHVLRPKELVADDPIRDAEEIADQGIAPGIADRGTFHGQELLHTPIALDQGARSSLLE